MNDTGTPSRLGETIELPWWVIPLSLPPVVALLGGIVIRAPFGARILDIVGSALMIYVVARVARRVHSRNMQSVYISAAYAFWAFAVLIWAVEAIAA